MKFFKNYNIRKQLYSIYILAICLPITIIGAFLLINTSRLLTNYHKDLLESDNMRVKTILFEITTQIYNMSREISSDENLGKILAQSDLSENDINTYINKITLVDKYIYNYAELEEVIIYTDNPCLHRYKQITPVDEATAGSDWYQKALNQASVFWVPMRTEDKFGNSYWNLCLVQRMPLVNTDNHAVLVMKVSDNYFKTRVSSGAYMTMLSVDDDPIFFSTERDTYGTEQKIPIDYEESYFQFQGNVGFDGKRYIANVSTLHMYQSDSKVYICIMNDKAYQNIRNIIAVCLMIIVLAILIPGFIIHFFTDYFTERILTLRKAMHRASLEDYDISESVLGDDEISGAFADLEIMVQRIKEKDAQVYEVLINEKELINEQQVMEFKMLASQINPHFLYNALETIRMKAFTAGDKEVATAIKLLGKSMRYVLENTGTRFTNLENELNHIETYLAIQKLRFGEKFEYKLEVAEDVNLGRYDILPLLLQPIVENAILHGLEEVESGGEIKVKIYKQQDENVNLWIEISDNGSGMEEAELQSLLENIEIYNPERSASIGLYNINQRMRLCYGDEYGIRIISGPKEGTCVKMWLPLCTNT